MSFICIQIYWTSVPICSTSKSIIRLTFPLMSYRDKDGIFVHSVLAYRRYSLVKSCGQASTRDIKYRTWLYYVHIHWQIHTYVSVAAEFHSDRCPRTRKQSASGIAALRPPLQPPGILQLPTTTRVVTFCPEINVLSLRRNGNADRIAFSFVAQIYWSTAEQPNTHKSAFNKNTDDSPSPQLCQSID